MFIKDYVLNANFALIKCNSVNGKKKTVTRLNMIFRKLKPGRNAYFI